MKSSRLAAMIVGGMIGLAPGLAGATVMFQQGIDGYDGTQDTYLKDYSKNGNYGGEAAVEIDKDSDKHGLLRFDNIFGSGSGLIPLGSTIVSASLELFIESGGNDVNMVQMLIDWSEDTATWNNLGGDGNGISAGESSPLRTLIGRPTDGSPLDESDMAQIFDVQQELQNWSDGQANYGWGFIATGSDGVDFSSSENGTEGNRPKLTVTFIAPTNDPQPSGPPQQSSEVAEPSALAVLGFGLAGLGLVRRRRRN